MEGVEFQPGSVRVSESDYMPVWLTESVETQPSLTLRPWRANRLPDGDIHLVGYCRENLEGRVSSAVLRVDPQARLVETHSGRTYRLLGPPGANLDAEYVWSVWAQANGGTEARDMSDELHRAMVAADDENGQGDR